MWRCKIKETSPPHIKCHALEDQIRSSMIRINEHAFCTFFLMGWSQDLDFTRSERPPFFFEKLLMEEIFANQLRLVVYPSIYQVLCIPGGCLGFLNHQQYHPFFQSSKKNQRFLPVMIQLLIFQVPLCHGIRLQDHVPRRNCFEGKVKSEKELADMTSLASKDPQKKIPSKCAD